jgi:diaminopimelate epimerase
MNFWKLQALGNDFAIVEREAVPHEADLGTIAARICDRHFGAGADGVLFVARAKARDCDVESRIFNADGSEAEVSGNGTRCLAAWLDAAGRWPDGEVVRIGTAAGVKAVRLVGREGERRIFEMEMGAPRLASREVPMRIDPPLERVVGYPLEAAGERVVVTALSMGNPHCSLLVEKLDPALLVRIGPALERHDLFPERTNVELVEIVARDRVRVLLWERGVGVTLASGTGASAAAAAAALAGRVGSLVAVETAAGELRVRWAGEGEPLYLEGPAEPVYSGVWTGAI